MWADAIARARIRLAAAGIPSPDNDARELAEFVAGERPRGRDGLTPEQRESFERVVSARVRRVPLQHITGTMYFRYLELEAAPGVFVVRPETEMVVEAALAEVKNIDDPLVVDLCTGSGAIAISIATESEARVLAVELDPRAFASAAKNNRAYGTLVTLIQGDARTELEELRNSVDVVVTNPPYVAPDHDLSAEVRQDPPLALYGGGADGLTIPIQLIERARYLLRPRGILIMEHGDEQGQALRAAAQVRGFVEVSTGQDLTGRNRWLRARKEGSAI